jgi:signal peptidase II
MVRGLGLRLAVFAAIAGTIGCDRLTKHVAITTLAGAPDRSWLGDTIRLTYAENTGAFLGLGSNWPTTIRAIVFTSVAFIGFALMAVLARRLRHVPPALVGLALIAGGSLSNFVDRVTYGSVVDFLNVGIGPVRTGIFNVADMAILAGAALVVVFSRPRSHAPSSAPTGGH